MAMVGDHMQSRQDLPMVPRVFVDIVDSSCGLEDERHPSYDPFPDGDGRPMADNDPQRLIMQTLDLGFRHLFERPPVPADVPSSHTLAAIDD